jgi:hypothetical protein
MAKLTQGKRERGSARSLSHPWENMVKKRLTAVPFCNVALTLARAMAVGPVAAGLLVSVQPMG